MAKFLQIYGDRDVPDHIAKAAKQDGESFIRSYVFRFTETKDNQKGQSVIDDFDNETFKNLTSFMDDILSVSEVARQASRTNHDSWEARENFGLHAVWRNRSR